MGCSGAPYNEILQNEIPEDPTPPPSAPGTGSGGGGGPTDTTRYLLQQGFSARAAHEFGHLDINALRGDLERRRGFGQGNGAIVTAWRVEPPRAQGAETARLAVMATRATDAKAQALAIAPPDVTPLEIQYLALDLEEGASAQVALNNLAARRSQDLIADAA